MTKIQLYRLVLYVLLCGCFAKASSQSHQLVINCTELTSNFLQKELQLKTVFTTKLQCKTYIEQLPILLQSKDCSMQKKHWMAGSVLKKVFISVGA